jgi:hypothetical protein
LLINEWLNKKIISYSEAISNKLSTLQAYTELYLYNNFFTILKQNNKGTKIYKGLDNYAAFMSLVQEALFGIWGSYDILYNFKSISPDVCGTVGRKQRKRNPSWV